MTILITGSSGKTARRLAILLRPSQKILIASRSGANVGEIQGVKFDWADTTSYANPYFHPQAQESPIKGVYLVSQPGNTNPYGIMKPFIDTAKAHGVKRFVLLSAIREDETTPGTGKVHRYLKELGVEWTVLRPTWFMGIDCVLNSKFVRAHHGVENFSEQQHLPTIRGESLIYSAAGDGKISFVSTKDIAAVAYHALVDEKAHNCDYVIVGPECMSHDEAAALFTKVLQREVRHVRLSPEQVVEAFSKIGLPEAYGRRLADGELRASQGEFAILNNIVRQVVGRPPISLHQYIEENKQVWER